MIADLTCHCDKKLLILAENSNVGAGALDSPWYNGSEFAEGAVEHARPYRRGVEGAAPYIEEKHHPCGWCFRLEQDTGVEPAFTAWEAVVLPIYESCIGMYLQLTGAIIADPKVKFNHNLSMG